MNRPKYIQQPQIEGFFFSLLYLPGGCAVWKLGDLYACQKQKQLLAWAGSYWARLFSRKVTSVSIASRKLYGDDYAMKQKIKAFRSAAPKSFIFLSDYWFANNNRSTVYVCGISRASTALENKNHNMMTQRFRFFTSLLPSLLLYCNGLLRLETAKETIVIIFLHLWL